MATYSFKCVSKRHPDDMDREFVSVINHREGKRIDQYPCQCGAMAKRDLEKDLASVNMTGLTPISHSTSGKGSVAQTVEFLAGRFRKNPDGTVDKNHRPFRDTGELNKFMNGQNDLGDPVVKDNGEPLRRKDGSVVRKGAKLFKYGANATPSRDGVRKQRPRLSPGSGWVSEGQARDGAGGTRISGAPSYKSPPRGITRPR